MIRPDVNDFASVLTTRYEYLHAIVERPRSKRDLVEDLDPSRATAGRTLRELNSVGLAQYADGLWKSTPLGRCVCDATDDFVGQLEDYAEAAPVIDQLRLEDPIDRSFVRGADVYENELDTPRAIIRSLLDSLEQASTVQVATPVLFPGFNEMFYERVAGGDRLLEIVVPDEVFEYAHCMNPSVTGRLLDDSSVTLYGGQVSFSYALWIADGSRTGMIVLGDYGIAGALLNESVDAVTWALDKYERTKGGARPVMVRGDIATV